MRFSNTDDIGYYVYALFDPDTNEVFYIGKGRGNRVFNHAENALINEDITSNKIEKIKEIQRRGKDVRAIIIRHQLSEEEAFIVESSLLDVMSFIGKSLTNLQAGHNSRHVGLMTVDELEQKYTLEKLGRLPTGFISININKTYKRGSNPDAIYQATKEAWVINERKINQITHVLSEYRGRVVGVYSNLEWYKIEINGRTRYGFNGKPAIELQNDYMNKLVPPRKKGAIAPVRFNFNWD